MEMLINLTSELLGVNGCWLIEPLSVLQELNGIIMEHFFWEAVRDVGVIIDVLLDRVGMIIVIKFIQFLEPIIMPHNKQCVNKLHMFKGHN